MKPSSHNGVARPSKIKLISFISFLFGFADAFLVYILSTYFQLVVGTENISALYLIAFTIVLLSLFYVHDIIRIVGKSMFLYILLIASIVLNASLIFLEPSWFTITLLITHLVVTNLIWVSIDIILESFSEDGKSGRIRGFFLTIVNAGWLIAPLLSTRVLSQSGYSHIFFIGLVLYSIILIIALLGLRRINHRFKERITTWQVIRKMRRRKSIAYVYFIALGIEFFYAVMTVYSPLYLLNLGFTWNEIGLIFTAMLLPFVLIEYPIGFLADKKYGEKEMLIFFLCVTIVSTLWLPFISGAALVLWMIALFVTRIGAAGIDILRDTYFYKHIGAKDVDIIAFYRTARPIASIFAALVVGISLYFTSLSIIFYIIAIVLALSLIPAILLVDTVSERESDGFSVQMEV